MCRAVRFLALLFSFLSIQLSLFGGGTGCDLSMVVMTGSETMAAMDMSATTDGDHQAPDACDVPSDDGPCSGMTVCVFAAVTSAGVDVPAAIAMSAFNDVVRTTVLTSTAFSPDHPPPRA
jgi:hypothetical protein